MPDIEIRSAFGKRLKNLRKQHKWTQKELASKLGVKFSQLNKYEGGVNIPSVETLVAISELFSVSMDFLITGSSQETAEQIHNTRLIKRLKALEEFKTEDQETVINVIDAMIAKQRMTSVLKPFD